MEPTTGPADPADETLLDVEQLALIEAELADVARALERLDEGTYGTCVGCGVALDDDVLADTPTADRCAQHLA